MKNSSVGLISAGTVFEGTMETLPEFVVDELKKNRGTFKILPDIKVKKQTKQRAKSKPKPPVEPKVESPQKEKPASLREKLNTPEK
jgi:hypothetical protein